MKGPQQECAIGRMVVLETGLAAREDDLQTLAAPLCFLFVGLWFRPAGATSGSLDRALGPGLETWKVWACLAAWKASTAWRAGRRTMFDFIIAEYITSAYGSMLAVIRWLFFRKVSVSAAHLCQIEPGTLRSPGVSFFSSSGRQVRHGYFVQNEQ